MDTAQGLNYIDVQICVDEEQGKKMPNGQRGVRVASAMRSKCYGVNVVYASFEPLNRMQPIRNIA